MNGSFLLQAVVYLGAALLFVPLAKRLGLGSVLGYLLAGIVIGPFLMGFVGAEGESIMHFAEFGVVMMLFLVGLELEPSHFWRMRQSILGMGMSQVLVTALVLFAGGLAIGLSWQAALAAGLALSMSSTAIVLQSLKEKGMMNTAAGQGSFSVLLFQDIAVIPILAVLPLMAVAPLVLPEALGDHHAEATLLDGLPAWVQTLSVLGAVALIIVAGRYLVGPLLHIVARTRLRELFAACALFLVVAIAYLMEQVGLSPALGTFLAGVVLANSEYRHELESDLEPFKGLLLGLFFMAVGASINFELIIGNPGTIVGLVLAVMLLKMIILFGIGKLFRMGLDQNLLFSLGLAQVGEFAFVLLSFIDQLGIMEAESIGMLMAVTAISMTLTPLIMVLYERVLQPNIGTKERVAVAPDVVDTKHAVILVGFSHFGSTIGRFLRAHGVEATILDNDSDRVELLRKMGFKVFYGDATRLDLLKSAGVEEAKILISAIDSPETNHTLVEIAKMHFPHLQLMIRAKDRYDAYNLLDQGVEDFYRESLDTSIRMGVDALRKLGFRAHALARAAKNFRKHDEYSLRRLAEDRHDKQKYILRVREEIECQESLLAADLRAQIPDQGHAWDSEQMRERILKGTT